MKKTLFFLAISTFLSTGNLKAQKTWDFASSPWADNSTGYNTTIVDNLGIFSGPSVTNMAIVESNSKTFADGTSTTKRLKLGGASWENTTTAPYILPTKRFLYFNVTGPCAITIWFFSSSSSASSTLNVTDGTSVIGTGTANGTTGNYFTTNYTGGAGTIYIGAIPTQAANIYKITVSANLGTTTTLATENFNKNKTTIFSNNDQVYIKNIKSSTKISVYSTTGSLLKSLNTNSDTNFTLSPGVYIVNTSSDKGNSSQKVIIK